MEIGAWVFLELFQDGVFFGKGYLGRQGLGRLGLDDFVPKIIILSLRSLSRVSILKVVRLVNPAALG